MGGRTAPCLLAVALSSVLILIISRQLPCVCRVASRGSSAACMVTAILEVTVGNVCAWPFRLSWRGVLRFPADKERRGGRVKRFASLKSAWLPVSRLGGLPGLRSMLAAYIWPGTYYSCQMSLRCFPLENSEMVLYWTPLAVRCFADFLVDLANGRNLYHMHLSHVHSASQLVSWLIPPRGICLNQSPDIL